jgi:hypothetical protein
MFIYIRIVVVLIYFIDEDRIDQFEGEIQSSDWLELSEKQCARTTPSWPQRNGYNKRSTLHRPNDTR